MGHFSLFPSLSFLYISHPFPLLFPSSFSPAVSFAFHLFSYPVLSNSIVLAEAAVTRDGDQASRGSWLRRIFSLIPLPLSSPRPFSFIWQTVYIFHRLEILFARSVAKLSRFEIFMNGSLRGLTHGPSGGRTKRG